MNEIIEKIYSLIEETDNLINIPLISLLKFLSFVASIILIYGITHSLIKSGFIKSRMKKLKTFWLESKYEKYEKKQVIKEWQKIVSLARMEDKNSIKKAILRADNLLNEILKSAGRRGENTEERLSGISISQIPEIEKIRDANKIAKKIEDGETINLSKEEGIKTLLIYEKIFKNQNLLG